MIYYAHSGLSKRSVPAQRYDEHIKNMYYEAIEESKILSPFLRKATLISVLFHDFGKLDSIAQTVLCQPDAVEGAKIPNHVDAGVAWCLKQWEQTNRIDASFLYGAWLIHAHHIGLKDREELFKTRLNMATIVVDICQGFRDTKFKDFINNRIKDHFDSSLDTLSAIQYGMLKKEIDETLALTYDTQNVTSIEMRFALSVLVESDHGDTSRHYGAPNFKKYPLKPTERLKRLHKQIVVKRQQALAKGIPQDVIDSRGVLFKECTDCDIDRNGMFICAAPTGKGKTLSLQNLALRLAEKYNSERIFFVIPYTNIISQSVKEYRSALILPNEDSKRIVNEIHSKVDFGKNWILRKYSHLWNAPINVCTAVQFFESMFSNHPSTVRKLMQFANSVVVFDEYHTSIPHHLWNLVLRTLKFISHKFNIRFVFGSGTQIYYWSGVFDDLDNDERFDIKEVITDDIFNDFKEFEKTRILFSDLGELPDDITFYNEFNRLAVKEDSLHSNAIIVCNTVKNAYKITEHFKESNPKWKVFHLSSYLTPVDREKILEKIHDSLKGPEKILLVATSLVECGIDFSFEIGFREKASLMSTIQFGGRVNRNKENPIGHVYEFSFPNRKAVLDQIGFSKNPSMNLAIRSREGLEVDPDNCTEAVKEEIRLHNRRTFVKEENALKLEEVANNFIVIDNLTATVIIDPMIVQKIQNGEDVNPVDIGRNSITIYRNRLDEENVSNWLTWIEEFDRDEETIYYWSGEYDSEVFGISKQVFENAP